MVTSIIAHTVITEKQGHSKRSGLEFRITCLKEVVLSFASHVQILMQTSHICSFANFGINNLNG